MELSKFFKAILEEDHAPIVVCDLNHIIIYMNKAAIKNYKKSGGAALLGTSLLTCHNEESKEKILNVFSYFENDVTHNRIHTVYNAKRNRDEYMCALREDDGTLIGYYEKHEYRTIDDTPFYEFK